MSIRDGRKSAPIRFVSIYNTAGFEQILHRLLKERSQYMNISHKRVPSFAEHCRFVRSKPYDEWCFIMNEGTILGAIYLSRLNEIGIFLFKAFRGKGLEKEALKFFIAKHRKRRLLVNVSPKNKCYERIFQNLGFTYIQKTYCLEKVKKR